MPSSLDTVIKRIETRHNINDSNRKLLYTFVDFMKTQTETSEEYKRNNLMVIILYAEFLCDRALSEVKSKQEITSFLDTRIKDESIDPDKKWIRTWNDYLQRIKFFMRWIHNDASLPPSEWQTPAFAQIKKRKTKRLSPYVESELWEREDLLTVVKYETNKRNKAALTLLWDFNARPHEVTRLKIKHIRLRERYGEAEIPHDSKTGSGPAMLTCSFPYVRDWLNEHPFRNELDARVICNLRTGGPITADSLWTIMRQLRTRISVLIHSSSITDEKELANLQHLIKSKNWAPYCLRHSSITCDAESYSEFALRKKVRWSMNSNQPARYIKNRWGKDLKNQILLQNGIITDVDAKPKPTVADCARCQLINPLENKYCSSCGYPLSVAAYEELKAADNEELDKIKMQLQELKAAEAEHSQDYKYLQNKADEYQAQMYEVMSKMDKFDKIWRDQFKKVAAEIRRSPEKWKEIEEADKKGEPYQLWKSEFSDEFVQEQLERRRQQKKMKNERMVIKID